MSGDPEQTCQTDQTWSPSAPLCVQCDALGELSSGSIAITTNGLISTATYTCISGYALVGGASRDCQIDGTWDGSKPLCKCGSPTTPANGVVLSDGVTANYSCAANHTLYGPQYRTCGDDGTGWTDSDPLCTACQALNAPVGGTVVIATTGTQTYALFYCEQGYTISGGYKVYCQSDGSWDTLPICAACTPLTAPDSGAVSTYTTGRVTMATFTCYSGYDLNGDGTNTCLTDGSWQLESPICTCQSPASIQHGEVSDDGVTAVYTCDVGYSLDGATDRACAADGSGWQGSERICNPCDTLDTPTGGNVTLTTDGINTVAAHICHVGYILTGTDIITCRSDGTWDFSQPECVSCPMLDAPSSGSIAMDTDSKTSTATFSCNTGYYISGSLLLTCLTNGQWDNEPPTCKCITPAAPSYGSVYVSDTSQGPVATYQCELGYSINGLTSRLCLSNGTGWQGDDPVCSECSNVAVTDGLEVSTVTNGIITTAEYTCNVNYTLSGTQDLTCLSDGTWNNSPPACVECATLNPPASGVVLLSTSGTMTEATYSCSSGYYVSGAITITCQTSGQWDDLPPLCRCLTPAAPQYGSVSVSDTSQGPLATYLCTTGHSINGMVSRQCLDDGTGWEGSDPSCNTCNQITTTQELQYLISSNGSSSFATYACALNYSLSGEYEHTCNADGSWNFAQPTCVICPEKHNPLSGQVTMATDGLNTLATFSCVKGYSLNSTAESKCLTDGTWDNLDPYCICDPPKEVSNGEYILLADGMLINFTCDDGYELVGPRIMECLTNGSGWNDTQPICDQLEPTSVPVGASTDNTVLSIPIGAFIAMVIVVIILVILLIILALCYRNRMRKDRQRISATFDPHSPGKQISESTRFNFESPDVENGKAKLLKNEENKNSKFNARKIKKKSSQGSLKTENRNGTTEGILQDMSKPPPVETIPNGLSPKSVPLASVRLPKLPPRPRHGQGGTPHKTKRKRRRVERREIQEHPTPESNTTSSTPVEIIMNRLNTPDILESAKFDYIQPQFCHEVQTPSPSRPSTSVTVGRRVTVFSDDDPTSESNV